jgi:microcystin-dependent protein
MNFTLNYFKKVPHHKNFSMKKSYLILLFLVSFFSFQKVSAQANVTSSGISIQGIARDENNAAQANIDQLSLTFRIYYLGTGSTEVQILSQTANVKTDNFGVFSYVLTISNAIFTEISNNASYLKVSQGNVVFSDEKLQAVPYAIHAQNGVPTGTIMAYIGATAPAGWLLCDGAAFSDNTTNAKLKELLGGLNTPNLNARYLRGTGAVTGKEAIALKGTQDDTFKPHNHGVGSLATASNGDHTHSAGDGYEKLSKTDNRYWVDSENVHMGNALATTNPANRTNIYESRTMTTTGAHTHTISGNTADSGNATVNETRVYSYGVTWIIKI